MNQDKEEKKINSERQIYALYDEFKVRVYQAYNDKIADEAIEKGTFGSSFKLERMTWIKPSFLWMMYRSGWASKEGQTRVLAIDIKREGFDFIVNHAVSSSYSKELSITVDQWREKLRKSEIRCQWDPERDVFGNPLKQRSIQLGLRGNTVFNYVNEWIISITDITQYVKDIKVKIDSNQEYKDLLPIESKYLPLKIFNMDQN